MMTVAWPGEEVRDLVIAGWAGRDAAAVAEHIRELQAIGVPPPRATPMFYRLSPALLTTEGEIAVAGAGSSGEVECVLVSCASGLLLGVGSDHTDRGLEAHGVTFSKQACAKPVAPQMWRWEDVADHFDRLVLRSWATTGGIRQLYQEGSVAALRAPAELAELNWGSPRPPQGSAMFCGTLPVHGEIRLADRFEIELEDPVLDRSLRHAYAARVLPIAD